MSRSLSKYLTPIILGLISLCLVPSNSDAALLDWLLPFRQQRLERRARRLNNRLGQNQLRTSYYGSLPSYSRNVSGNWNGWGRIPTTANFQPVTAYRTVWTPVPVTNTSPIAANTVQSCTSYDWQARRIPYTTYQPTAWATPTQWGHGSSQSGWQTLARPTALTSQYAQGFGRGVVGNNDWRNDSLSGIAPIPSTCQACESASPADMPPRIYSNFAPQANTYSSNDALKATPWVAVEAATDSPGLNRLPADVAPTLPAREGDRSFDWKSSDGSEGSTTRPNQSYRMQSYDEPATRDEFLRNREWKTLDTPPQASNDSESPSNSDRASDWKRLGSNDRSKNSHDSKLIELRQPQRLPKLRSPAPPENQSNVREHLVSEDRNPTHSDNTRGWYVERRKQKPRYLPPRHLRKSANKSKNVVSPIRPGSQYEWRAHPERTDRTNEEIQPIPGFRSDSWDQQSRDEDGRTASLITYTRWKAKPTSNNRNHDSDDDWYSARR